MDKRSLIFIALISVTFIVMQFLVPSGEKEKPSEEKPISSVEEKIIETAEIKRSDESFYILENDYQQLVFSNYGGAVAEINLPFHSKTNPNSIIHPIEFDKLIYEKYPEIDRFPVYGDMTGGFYPLLRRNLPSQKISPNYYLADISSDKEDLQNLKYTMTLKEKNRIQFVAKTANRTITKTFVLSNDTPYFFDLFVEVVGNKDNLWIGSGVCEAELASGRFSPEIKISEFLNSKHKVSSLKIPKNLEVTTSSSPAIDWIVSTNGYLGLMVDPIEKAPLSYRIKKIDGNEIPSRITVIDEKNALYPKDKYYGIEVLLPLSRSSNTDHFRFFAGPLHHPLLVKADKSFLEKEKIVTNYSSLSNTFGFFSFISVPFAKFLKLLMNFFYLITHSWGISIILLTIALRIMLYPLNTWSIKSNTRLQEIGPKVKLLQERYKKEPKQLQVETLKLYKEEKINPFSGCFPILIQIPFLIGLFDLLKTSFELRGASFIPGWIDNLAAPDVLFEWNTSIFIIGTQFHLLPILIGLAMFIQQKMSVKLPKDKSELTDQQKQQKMLGLIMPFLLTFLFYNMPAGLNIYFFVSTILGMVQQLIVQKKQFPKPPELKRIK